MTASAACLAACYALRHEKLIRMAGRQADWLAGCGLPVVWITNRFDTVRHRIENKQMIKFATVCHKQKVSHLPFPI